jgi:hypothetical protein
MVLAAMARKAVAVVSRTLRVCCVVGSCIACVVRCDVVCVSLLLLLTFSLSTLTPKLLFPRAFAVTPFGVGFKAAEKECGAGG